MKDPDLDLTTCSARSALAKVTMMMLLMVMVMIAKLLKTKLVLKLMAIIVALDDNELMIGYLDMMLTMMKMIIKNNFHIFEPSESG